MRCRVFAFVLALVATGAAPAAAGDDEPPAPLPPPAPPPIPPPPPAYMPEPAPRGPPLAHHGFQLGVRSGASFALGSMTAGTGMRDLSAWQVPLHLDIGAKTSSRLFVGGYVGLAFGGGGTAYPCKDPATCTSFGYRLGFEIQYHAAPHALVNPWVGYGIGYESLSIGHDDPGGASGPVCKDSGRASGIELARLEGGVDFRVSRLLGVGGFASAAAGQYLSHSLGSGCAAGAGLGGRFNDAEFDRNAFHLWLTLGARFVLYP